MRRGEGDGKEAGKRDGYVCARTRPPPPASSPFIARDAPPSNARKVVAFSRPIASMATVGSLGRSTQVGEGLESGRRMERDGGLALIMGWWRRGAGKGHHHLVWVMLPPLLLLPSSCGLGFGWDSRGVAKGSMVCGVDGGDEGIEGQQGFPSTRGGSCVRRYVDQLISLP